jgi:lincosamide nucleotidyltransferase A/C/D/E
MDAQDVLDVVAVLEDAGVAGTWLDGGWGVDALLGEQHRDHHDADIVVPADDLDLVISALAEVGFAVTTDHRPTRMELMDRAGRVIDLQPVTFDEAGDAWQRGAAPGGGDAHFPATSFTYGWIGGRKVACVGPEVQVAHHLGYEPSKQDREDMSRIRERFVLPLPDTYR